MEIVLVNISEIKCNINKMNWDESLKNYYIAPKKLIKFIKHNEKYKKTIDIKWKIMYPEFDIFLR